jgi:hypothetical protein
MQLVFKSPSQELSWVAWIWSKDKTKGAAARRLRAHANWLGAGELVKRYSELIVLLALTCWSGSPAAAGLHHHVDLQAVNAKLAGTVVDHTHNHGADRRIWSAALCQPRDLYVYLPPAFDPCLRYPLVLWLHPFMEDEQTFLDWLVECIDRDIVLGRLPPLIVAAPDGSLSGNPSMFSAGSFFINSKAGNFEDYVMQDVLGFVCSQYPIRPEREAHVLAGGSMGGFAAFNLGMKYQRCFKYVIGIFPPLNLRWVDCHGRYMADFDPCCWGWRQTADRGCEVIGRFYCGLIKIRLKRLIDPLFGRGPQAVAALARENPIEMIDRFGLQNGQLDMYVAYAGLDEFNIDAQVESFLFFAKRRGLCVAVGYEPNGRHNQKTAQRLYPGIINWLGPRLAQCAAAVPESGPVFPEILGMPAAIP